MDDTLNTLIEPENIPFSFDTIGWIVSLYLIFALIISFLIYKLVQYHRNKYRRIAINRLLDIKNSTTLSMAQKANLTNNTLKQVCLHKFPRKEIASLDDIEWFGFLNFHMRKPCFDMLTFESFQKGLYKNSQLKPEIINCFIAQSITWIDKHVV
ncbi:DUF4381 domain-containing protein [Carboxylicivirga marina]|uniref:DUF4381 domain-containing protein n=1 Tax=Carboxylicivirga marina TaxID=2800988 RepID=A0ABS1HFI0_9BACT|nr:DUF4381 domain-containing protein [Carboxylicivirga marina]MBK3516429.1 DUF4381 domain-containing protein [Carboxylicivirga marina]